MKERIDEYDMAKKMMSILRGGYKPLLNEFINAPDLNTDQTQGSVNDNQLWVMTKIIILIIKTIIKIWQSA
jgi:hypothetical protein